MLYEKYNYYFSDEQSDKKWGYKNQKGEKQVQHQCYPCFYITTISFYVLAIYIMNKTNKRDNHLKFRISKEEKENIDRKAKECNMNTSEYIRYCISLDYPSMLKRIPESIATSNLLNQIYHHIDGKIDDRLLADIKGYILDYYGRR